MLALPGAFYVVMAADSGEALPLRDQTMPENRELSSWSRRSAQMHSASGERPDGKTDGFTDRNGDKCFETFNQNNGCCHSTTVPACNCIPACVGGREARQLNPV
jgi:hypothetical protein